MDQATHASQAARANSQSPHSVDAGLSFVDSMCHVSQASPVTALYANMLPYLCVSTLLPAAIMTPQGADEDHKEEYEKCVWK